MYADKFNKKELPSILRADDLSEKNMPLISHCLFFTEGSQGSHGILISAVV